MTGEPAKVGELMTAGSSVVKTRVGTALFAAALGIAAVVSAGIEMDSGSPEPVLARGNVVQAYPG